MKKSVKLARVSTLFIGLLFCVQLGTASAETLLKAGARGKDVRTLQTYLKAKGYIQSIDGIFGSQTKLAVQRFQKQVGLQADGVVGQLTWNKLKSGAASRSGSIKQPVSRGAAAGERGELLDWNQADKLIPVGTTFTITDIDTGKTFKAVRNQGHNHADSDPLNQEDTKILKSLYGGQYSWERRAVLVTIGDRVIAASINGMPHGRSIRPNNGFPGHFCVHFLNSSTHGSSYTKSKTPTVDPGHQAMVKKAAGI